MSDGMDEAGYVVLPEIVADHVVPFPPGWTFTSYPTDEQALARSRRLLDDDAVAATIVAATINTRQAAGESGPAFVKRIVRSWLEEIARVHP